MPVFLSRHLNSEQNHRVETRKDIKRRKEDSFSADAGWRGVVRGFVKRPYAGSCPLFPFPLLYKVGPVSDPTHWVYFRLTSSVADPGCLYRFRIQGQKDPGSASKNLIIFNPKNCF